MDFILFEMKKANASIFLHKDGRRRHVCKKIRWSSRNLARIDRPKKTLLVQAYKTSSESHFLRRCKSFHLLQRIVTRKRVWIMVDSRHDHLLVFSSATPTDNKTDIGHQIKMLDGCAYSRATYACQIHNCRD